MCGLGCLVRDERVHDFIFIDASMTGRPPVRRITARITAASAAPGVPHPGHHGRGRGPGCGYHGDAPGRPDLPPFAG